MNRKLDSDITHRIETDSSLDRLSYSSAQRLEKFSKAKNLISSLQGNKSKLFSILSKANSNISNNVSPRNREPQLFKFIYSRNTHYQGRNDRIPFSRVIGDLQVLSSPKSKMVKFEIKENTNFNCLSLEIENLKNKINQISTQSNNFLKPNQSSSSQSESEKSSTISDLSSTSLTSDSHHQPSYSNSNNRERSQNSLNSENSKQLRKLLFNVKEDCKLKEEFEDIFSGENGLFEDISKRKYEILFGGMMKLINKYIKRVKVQDIIDVPTKRGNSNTKPPTFTKINESPHRLNLPLKTIEQTLQDSSLKVSNVTSKFRTEISENGSNEEFDTVNANYSLENLTQQQSLLQMPFQPKQLSSHREADVREETRKLPSYSLNGGNSGNDGLRRGSSIASPNGLMPHLRDRFNNSVQSRKSVLYNNRSLEKPRLSEFNVKVIGIESIQKKHRPQTLKPNISPKTFNIITNE